MFHPYGNPHSNETLFWGAEPRYRGTYSISSSCIITIALCVWTAVHLNVPEYGKVMPQFWRKMFWMLVGLLAPELVAWTAFQQLQKAKRIRDDMRKLFGQPPIPTIINRLRHKLLILVQWISSKPSDIVADDIDLEAPPTERPGLTGRQPWTSTHGHYLAMGGFAVNVNDAPYIFPSHYPTTRFVLQNGLLVLLQLVPDLVPDLSELEIKDKSKANGFAKTLICLQALWLCTQIIVRAASRLTISILELNTFAHALCTLPIYILWWDKPLDITEPTIIRGEAAHPTIALLSVLQDSTESTACVIIPRPSDEEDIGGRYQIERQAAPIKVVFDMWNNHAISWPSEMMKRAREGYDAEVPVAQGFSRVYDDELFPRTNITVRIRRYSKLSRTSDLKPKNLQYSIAMDLPSSTTDRLELAQSVRRQFQDQDEPDIMGDYLANRVRNTSFPDHEAFWHFFFGITIAGITYGGLHLSAWDAPMSQTARLLWRISAIMVASTGAMWLPFQLYLVTNLHGSKRDPLLYRIVAYMTSLFATEAGERIVLAYVIVVAVVYVAARIYLVVECFINVRHLPGSTFEVPTWSQYFPHIA